MVPSGKTAELLSGPNELTRKRIGGSLYHSGARRCTRLADSILLTEHEEGDRKGLLPNLE